MTVDDQQVVVFALDGRKYAFALDVVERVIHAVEITPVAGAPTPVLGVINLRGDVLPVLGLWSLVGAPARPVEPKHRILIASMAALRFGVVVDEVIGLAAGSDSYAGAPQLAGSNEVSGTITTGDGELIQVFARTALVRMPGVRALTAAADSVEAAPALEA